MQAHQTPPWHGLPAHASPGEVDSPHQPREPQPPRSATPSSRSQRRSLQ
jgi:hypothetical protein